MTYPRKWAVATATGDHLKDLDWDAMVDAANGMNIAGGVTIQYPYSFCVRNVGGVYDAINGNGVLTYGGSSDAGGIDGGDAAAVIQEATDYLTTGGRIFIRKGIYTLLRAIDYKSSVFYEGEAKGTTTLCPVTTFTVPDGAAHRMFENTTHVVYGGLKHLNFAGNNLYGGAGSATGDIFLGANIGTSEFTIDSCYFFDAGRDCIGFNTANSEANKIVNCMVDYAGRYGILFFNSNDNVVKDSSVNHTIDVGICNYFGAGNVFNGVQSLWNLSHGMWNYNSYRTLITQCKFGNNANHGVLDEETANNIYTSNVFLDNSQVGANQKDGLCFTGTSHDFIVANNISMCSEDPMKQRYGISTGAATTNPIILGNNVNYNLVPMLIAGGATIGGIQGNYGYLSENIGWAAATGAGQTIVHGLSSMPTSVVITPLNTGAVVSNVYCDATNLYCTVTAGSSFNWKVTSN
jgi:hypothetical protein